MGEQMKTVAIAIAALPALAFAAAAQELPPKAVYEAMLAANKATGWVQFRNFNGRQLIYFTALQTMHCRLSEIRFSINSDALDERFPLVPCNPQTPFSMPSDVKPDEVFVSLPRNAARTVTVQAVWEDGTESEVMTYKPCEDVGESSCAAVAE